MSRLRWCLVFVLALLLGSLLRVAAVQAAQIPYFSVLMPRQTVSTSTDMQVTFISPTGMDNSGDYFELQFPNDFNVSALTISDIQLSYGPTTGFEHATSLTASAGATTWGWDRNGLAMRFSPPLSTVPGSIPANTRFVVRIGTLAGGVNQLVTPTTAGIYRLTINGNFGDSGVSYVSVRGADGLAVSVTVPVPGGGGGGGGGAGGGGSGLTDGPVSIDGTAPVISGLRAESITTNSAIIRWTTDEAADAYLEYGLTTAYGAGTRTRSDRRTSHEFSLEGLTPDTDYHLRVRARDAVGNSAWSSDFVFRTARPTLAPVISGLVVSYVDDRQAIIRWTTDVETTYELELTTPSGPRVFRSSLFARDHQLEVGTLQAGTGYSFRVTVTNRTGQQASDAKTFRTTNDVTPPSNVSGFRAVYNGVTRAVDLSWNNPTDPDFKHVVITRLSGVSGVADTFVCMTLAGRCSDVSLVGSGPTFTYRAVAVDLVGNESSGALASVVVPRATVEPPVEIVPPTEETPEVTTPSEVLPPILRPTPTAGGETPVAPGEGAGVTPSGGEVSSTTDPVVPAAATTTPDLPTDPAAGGEGSLLLMPEFFLSEAVVASPDRSGIRSALLLRPIQLRLPITSLPTALRAAQVQTGDGAIYQLAYRESLGAYVSDFLIEGAPGQIQTLRVQAVASDNRTWEGRYPFRLVAPGQVSDISDRNRSTPVAGVTVEISSQALGGSILNVQTDVSGRYAAILARGAYRIKISKEGFRSYDETVQVETGILAKDIQLRRSVMGLSELIDPNASLAENVDHLVNEAALVLEAVRQPEVQKVTESVVAPVVVVATLGTTATAVTGFAAFNYLRFLFTQPLLLIRRRRRQSWGVVYNALSKQPVELAIVRLMKAGTNFALQTRITDAQGRFSFFVPPGSYTIQIQKPGYQFPSTYLKEARIDVDFVDLYHGEAIEVKEPVTISPNIPLDPIVKEETPKAILRRQYWRKLQSALSISGIVIALAAIVISPSWPMIGFAVFQIATYALFRRLAVPPAPQRWGIVYDNDGKHPLTKAVVRIFDKKFNKLLETQITSKDGTYGFFAAKGVYYLTAEKPGYERYLSTDIDLTQAKDTYIDHRFTLKKGAQLVH